MNTGPGVQLMLIVIGEAGPGPASKSQVTFHLLSRISEILTNSYDDVAWLAVLLTCFFSS